MTACMVGNDTQCIETWNVTAVNCGEYNIVYLDHTEHCGRYCSGMYMYSETCLNRTSMNPAFVFGIDGCLVYTG